MRRPGLLALIAFAACGGNDNGPDVYEFGPFTLQPSAEDEDKCVQISLHNDEPIYVNSVELTTGPGFHHSNWFFVPDHTFAGPDGTFTCRDRNFNIGAAAIVGGVFFAQSTQSPKELQAFPSGMAIKLPANAKLVAQIHLLNTTDEPLEIKPTIALTKLPESSVTQLLAGISMEFHPLSLPPQMQSRFSVDCDLDPLHQMNLGRAPDFSIFYTLAHYHQYGTRMLLEAVRPDGTASTIYTTSNSIGDALGGPLSPPFDMTGYTRLRLTCEYRNTTDAMIYYGNGDGEMCVFLAFSDSPWMFGGGVLDTTPMPNSGVVEDGFMSYTRNCNLFTREAY